MKSGHGKIVLQNKSVEVAIMSQSEYTTGTGKYYHIQESECKSIERMKRAGASNGEIAKALCRHRSTIGRELKRNAVIQRETIQSYSKSISIPLFRDVKRYFWDSAQRQCTKRRLHTGAKCKLAACMDFVLYLEKKVSGPEKWSLDAARSYAARHAMFPMIPSTKTLYNRTDAGLLKIRSIDLLLKVKRRPLKKAKERKKVLGRSIDERPDRINQRQEFAHWVRPLTTACWVLSNGCWRTTAGMCAWRAPGSTGFPCTICSKMR